MKKEYSYIIMCVLLMFACSNDKTNYLPNEVVLQNNVGKVMVNLPAELDTFYTWVDSDDNGCSDEMKYRFSSSAFPVHKESGFFYKTYPDSSYRFTISHVNNFACQATPETYNDTYLAKWTKSLESAVKNSGDTLVWIRKEVRKINGRPFLVAAYVTEGVMRQKYLSTFLRAHTYLGSREISFWFECNAGECQGFVPRMLTSLHSVKMEEFRNESRQ